MSDKNTNSTPKVGKTSIRHSGNGEPSTTLKPVAPPPPKKKS